MFFTGTACVFRTPALRSHGMPDCITEDTYLSHDLLLEGQRIAYDDQVSPYEELAPDLKSYVARRPRPPAGAFSF